MRATGSRCDDENGLRETVRVTPADLLVGGCALRAPPLIGHDVLGPAAAAAGDETRRPGSQARGRHNDRHAVGTAEVSVACTVESDAPIDSLVNALAGLARVDVTPRCAIVVAVGEGLCHSPRTLERATRALGPIAPELVSFGGNERNLSFVVRYDDMAATMQRLHAEFFAEGALRSDDAARRQAVPPAAQRTFEASQ